MELMLFDEPKDAPSGTDRLIVVLLAPTSVARDLSKIGLELQEDHALRGTSRPTGHLHLTLFHLGDFAGLRENLVATARRACEAAARRSRKFSLKLDRASCSGKRRRNPLVLTAGEKNLPMLQLYQRLAIQFLQEGLRDQQSKFSPHVTLAYVDGSLSIELAEPVSWVAGEIVLIHSLLGKTQYIELGRWKLGA